MASSVTQKCNRAVAHSIIFHASLGNVLHMQELLPRLSDEQSKAVRQIISTHAPEGRVPKEKREDFKVRVSAALPVQEHESAGAIFKVLDLVPKFLSYCSFDEISRASQANSLFHSHASLACLEQLRERTSLSEKALNGYQKALHLSSWSDLLKIAGTLTHIVHLDFKELDSRWCEPAQLKAVLQHCPNLKSININRACSSFREVLTDLAAYCPKLKKIDLGMVWPPSDTLPILAQGCRNLREIDLSGNTHIAARDLISFTQNAVHLERVNLNHLDQLTEESFLAFAKNCPRLTHVVNDEYYGRPTVGQETIRRFVGMCSHLQSISLGLDATDVTLIAIAHARGPAMKHIKVKESHVTNKGIEQAAALCPNLESFHFYPGLHVSKEAVYSLAKHCPKLKTIDFTLESYYAGVSAITDAEIIALARGCPNLTTVILQHCEKLTEKAIQALGEHCHNITHINLLGCKDFANPEIIALAKGCPKLISLEAEYASDSAIQILVERCRELEHLVIKDSRFMTDASYLALTLNCPKLKTSLRDELAYTPETDLGRLYVAALNQKSFDDIQKLLDQVKDQKLLENIYHTICYLCELPHDKRGKTPLSIDPFTFFLALRKGILKRHDQLIFGDKVQVEKFIRHLRTTEPKPWISAENCNHVARLADAMGSLYLFKNDMTMDPNFKKRKNP